jgi:transcription initiation factor TFIID subunit TAF12
MQCITSKNSEVCTACLLYYSVFNSQCDTENPGPITAAAVLAVAAALWQQQQQQQQKQQQQQQQLTSHPAFEMWSSLYCLEPSA